MLKNYFKIAFRNIARHKGYAAINITGLAVGIAACLLLFLVIRYETGYDKAQPNYNRIYRVVSQDKFADGGITYNAGLPNPALEALRLEFPTIQFSAINSIYGSQITVGGADQNNFSDKKFIEDKGIFFCEPQFFQIFNYKWLTGTADVLKEPNTVVLTKNIAEKYFGDWQSATGKFLKLDNSILLKVGAVLDDVSEHSDFPLGVMASFETLKKNGGNYNYNATNWNGSSSNFQIYALLQNRSDEDNTNKQLLQFSKDHYAAKGAGTSVKINFIQPLSTLHFDKRFDIFGTHITSKSTLWTLLLIGVFIIIMACINFINLSTAQAVGRSKEVGIRKVLGSSRKQLFAQVMGETGLIVTISALLAIGIATACLPLIKHIASINEQLSMINVQTILFMVGIIIAVTLFAGLYPSLILSGFKPALALKNKMTSAKVGGISLRRGLVITQFGISQVLIIGTIVAITQMNFVRHADLGFDKEAVVILSGNSDSLALTRAEAFKQKLLQTPGVQSVSFATDAPSSDNNWTTNFAFDHREDEPYQLALKFGDNDYFKTFGLQMLAGREYVKSDTVHEMIINETLVKKLGLKSPQEAIGKDIRVGRGKWNQIVGVVKDFKTNSLREEVKPILITQNKEYYSLTAIKMRSSNIQQTHAAIENIWNSFFPEYAYSSAFMDDNINKFYEQENQLSLLYKIFAVIAILISSLGLYGLVSFMAVQKTKEVGIRKVLGASTGNIVYLFSKEFTILISIAFVLAAPLAYFMMNSWLQDFAYRIKMEVWVFAIAILISIIIAWITVGYKAVKAAVANPVKSLRSE